MSEFVGLPNGNVLAATETFDQSTGQVINVVAETHMRYDITSDEDKRDALVRTQAYRDARPSAPVVVPMAGAKG